MSFFKPGSFFQSTGTLDNLACSLLVHFLLSKHMNVSFFLRQVLSRGTSQPRNHTSGKGFTGSSAGKETACNVENPSSIPGSGRSSGEGHGNPLQYSFLENPHGQRDLERDSSWGCKESDMIEWLRTALWGKPWWFSKLNTYMQYPACRFCLNSKLKHYIPLVYMMFFKNIWFIHFFKIGK